MTYVIQTIEQINQANLIASGIYEAQKKQYSPQSLNRIFMLTSTWTYDRTNALISTGSEKFYLTHKEVLFLNMLIKDNSIISYDKMIFTLWDNKKSVTQNAIKLFIKDFRKKLPPKMLKNFKKMGYKLNLD